MRFTVTTLTNQADCASKTFRRISLTVILGLTMGSPASAISPGQGNVLHQQIDTNRDLAQVVMVRRGEVARRATVVGPRGGVRSRTVVRRGAVVRPGVRGAWVRPGWYRWPAGGAIAAGAAVGFVTVATAVAWASAPPEPDYCWRYTDPSKTKGFRDACPR